MAIGLQELNRHILTGGVQVQQNKKRACFTHSSSVYMMKQTWSKRRAHAVHVCFMFVSSGKRGISFGNDYCQWFNWRAVGHQHDCL